MYDLYRSEAYEENIALRISCLNGIGSPYHVSFSPQDKYIMVSEKPVNGVNVLKVYEVDSERTDTWTFNFEFKG